MKENSHYTLYHPRWLRPKMSTYWWLKQPAYLAFILRELSSLFVAWFVLYLLLLLSAVGAGSSVYLQFLEWSADPLVLLINLVALFLVVFHTITWFTLAPQAMALRLGGRRVPGAWITASHYLLWALISASLAWILIGE